MKTSKLFTLLDGVVNTMMYWNCLLEILLGAALSILLPVEVFCRYVLQSSLIFSEELSRLLFIWFALLGATVALHQGAHVGFDLLKKRFQGKTAAVVSVVTSLSILFYAAFLCYGCITILPKQLIQRYAALKISLFWSYLSVAVGMAFLFCRALYTFLCLAASRPENLRSIEQMFSSRMEAR
ncbi:MAG: TRAP transporter small permease [Anaerotruncus sp.]|jgi:TRAP-type C4-dicarboxylate transport system permease small subunit|nr:TRAP transporter small permease [Anaerotruncus sp.]